MKERAKKIELSVITLIRVFAAATMFGGLWLVN